MGIIWRKTKAILLGKENIKRWEYGKVIEIDWVDREEIAFEKADNWQRKRALNNKDKC